MVCFSFVSAEWVLKMGDALVANIFEFVSVTGVYDDQ